MDVRIYDILSRFNQGLDQAQKALDIVEKLELASPNYVSRIRTNLGGLRASANNHLVCEIAQQEQEEENNFYRVRQNREKAEEGPNEFDLELKSREELRREPALPPRPVILPWSQVGADRILAVQKAAYSWSPTQPESPRIIRASQQENQKGGRPA